MCRSEVVSPQTLSSFACLIVYCTLPYCLFVSDIVGRMTHMATSSGAKSTCSCSAPSFVFMNPHRYVTFSIDLWRGFCRTFVVMFSWNTTHSTAAEDLHFRFSFGILTFMGQWFVASHAFVVVLRLCAWFLCNVFLRKAHFVPLSLPSKSVRDKSPRWRQQCAGSQKAILLGAWKLARRRHVWVPCGVAPGLSTRHVPLVRVVETTVFRIPGSSGQWERKWSKKKCDFLREKNGFSETEVLARKNRTALEEKRN